MSSRTHFLFTYHYPDKPQHTNVAGSSSKAGAHRLRLQYFDEGYDCGPVRGVILSLPGTRGGSSLMQEGQG